jgi:hypothetical protein
MNSILYPNWIKANLVIVPVKISNPLIEHQEDILDGLPDNKIGRGGSKCFCENNKEQKNYILNVCLSTVWQDADRVAGYTVSNE